MLVRNSFSCAVLLLLAAAPASAQVGPTTHVEFNLSHTERIANANTVLTDSNLPAGIDGTTQADDTGSIDGVFGDHTVTVSASVDSPNGQTRLRARGQHSYELSGLNLTTDHWRQVNGTQTLRASHVDVFSFVGAPLEPLTVEMYWDVRGTDDALIDLLPGQAIVYSFSTGVSLDAATVAPNTGGGLFTPSVPWPGGFRNSDLDQDKVVEPDEEYAVMTFTVEPGEDLEVETTFEVTPNTVLNNTFEGFVLSTTVEGHHDAEFDQSAELVGVIVRDDLGAILPGISIDAASGNDYPVLEEVPIPPPPARVILSPVAVTTDLGEVGGSTPVGNMINQSGLAKPFTSDVTSFDGYFDFSPTPFSSATFSHNWQSQVDFALPVEGVIDFDLGGTRSIDRVALWNLSLENIRVQISDSASGPWTEVGVYTLPSHLAFLSYPADVLDLGGVHEADFVRIEVDSAYKFSSSDTFAYAIVGEMAVSAVPLPEPQPWLAWLAGAPAVALLRRLSRGTGSPRRAR